MSQPPSRPVRSGFRPGLGLLAAVLALPLAAQVRVQPRFSLLPSEGGLQLEARVLHHPSQACDWSVAAPGRVGPDGRFQGPPGSYTVRATSRADPAAWAEAGVVVLPGQPALAPALDLVAKVLGPEAVAPEWSTALPFRDIAGPGRFGPPRAQVHTLAGTGDLQTRILGYGLRVPVALPRTGVVSGVRLLSYLESGEPVRLDVTGDPCPELRLHGAPDRAQVESLDGDGRHWTSQTLRLRLRVRGLVPLAGSPAATPGDADGLGPAARFRRPAGLAVLGCGGLVAADPEAHVLRRIHPDHRVTTLLGAPGHPGHADGEGAAARFRGPTFLAACPGPTGPGLPAAAQGAAGGDRFLVADTGNHVVRAVDGQGRVTTLAGVPGQRGHRDGPAGQALFDTPHGLAVDARGPVYVADQGNRVIRRIAPDGTVSTFAGLPGQAGSQDGPRSRGTFRDLHGLTLACTGGPPGVLLQVLDGHSIRNVASDGGITTLCGISDQPGAAPGQLDPGPLAGVPCLDRPWGILAWGGVLCVTERGNHALRVLRPGSDGRVACVVLVGDRDHGALRHGLLRLGVPGPLGPGFAALGEPMGLAVDPGGQVYVADGPAVHLCSEPLVLQGLQPPQLSAPSEAPRGQPLDLSFTGPELLLELDPDAEEQPTLVFWTLDCLDPATGDPVRPALRGESRRHGLTRIQVAFEDPGEVDLHLTCVTAEGVPVKRIARIRIR